MAQVSTVIQADPQSLADALDALNAEVLIVEKTTSAGKFIVIYQAPSTSQTFTVIAGDPEKLSDEINDIIGGGDDVTLVIPTFSASHYVVVSE